MRDSKGRFIKGHASLLTKESNQKTSETCKKKGIGKWMKGRKLSLETRKKMSRNNSRYWAGKKRPENSGKLHPNWKEDKVSPTRTAIRESYKYKSWRMQVLARDNLTCQKCGSTDKLEVDHYPKRFVDILKDENISTFNEALNNKILWNLDIGRTLCHDCHRKTSTWGKRYTQ